MYVDFFSATFYALRHKNKQKYKLLTEDQVSYYFESLFIVVIQFLLCISILKKLATPTYQYDTELNLCMFFTNLVLHYGCIAIIRNGIQMCKFVVFHSEEFSNPIETFMLGLMIIFGNILCEITNALSSMT